MVTKVFVKCFILAAWWGITRRLIAISLLIRRNFLLHYLKVLSMNIPSVLFLHPAKQPAFPPLCLRSDDVAMGGEAECFLPQRWLIALSNNRSKLPMWPVPTNQRWARWSLTEQFYDKLVCEHLKTTTVIEPGRRKVG